ncbi:hypothetical protein [Rhodopirellula baltica]|uniref:Circumsporozoite protein-putative membrane associated protein n=1 Tax=Rhodopirellula baltica WH47 TaxID=991778 RepID=F2AWC4_RHOBT|nr:hypothetical protein [Rhodopirellula baltica]EGF26007.1 circumsporozoite protein-putative membrane associated protein [Rhodopirellula baltica WH47]
MIQTRIDAARSALWRAELTRQMLRGVLVAMAAMLAWVVMDQWIWSPGITGRLAVALIAIVAATVHIVRSVWPVMRSSVRADYAARALERDHPELGHALSSYITLTAQDSGDATSKGHLSKRVVQSIGATTAAKLRSIDALPEEATGLLRWWIATIALMSVLMIYAIASPKNTLQSAARVLAPTANIRPANRVQITDVQPGDAEILAGRTVVVSANIRGLREEESVEFRWLNSNVKESSHSSSNAIADGRSTQMQIDESTSTSATIAYTASIDVSHQAKGVQRYEIVAGDAVAGPFEWTIRDTPVVSVTEVEYQPPSYTGDSSRIRRSGSIRGVDGTRVTLRARVNRPVARAVVEFNPKPMGQEVRATAGVREMTLSDDGRSLELPFDLRSGEVATRAVELESYRIRVWDQAEQTNSDPIVYPIEVIRDLPPEITIVVPRRSPKPVPMDAQQLFEIHAADVDFGLSEIEIEIRRGIDLIARASLWKSESGEKGNQIAEYRFRPSRMILANAGRRGSRASRLMVGDEVEVVAVATDNRRDASNPNIQPGVTRTAPVRLQIVAGRDSEEQTPDEQDDNDGQTPDDGGSPDGSGAGEEGQSGGGGGSGESGQSEQSGQGGEGQSGSGESNSEQTGENENGGDSSGNSSGGESPEGDSDPNDPSKSNGGNSASNSNNNDGSDSSESSAGNPGEGSSDPDAMSEGQNNSNGGESGENKAGEPDNQQRSTDGSGQSGQGNSNQQNGDVGEQGSSESSEPGSNQDGSRGSSGAPEGSQESGGSRQPQSAPQDDAEAFERINEYLKEQQEREGGQQPSGENPSGDDSGGNDSNSPEPQGGTSQDGNSQKDPQRGTESESQSDDTNDPGAQQNGSEQSSGNPSNDDGAGEGSPSDDASSSGDAGEESSGKESGESGSDSSDAQSGEPSQASGDSEQPSADPGQTPDGSPSSEDSKGSQEGASDAGTQNSGNQDNSGDQDTSGGEGSEQGTPRDQAGDQNSSNQDASSDASPSGSDLSSSENASNNNDGPPSQSDSNGSESSNFTGESTASGNLNGSGDGEAELPKADPADLEYTKQATDMVLDYLNETRQDPDQNLLDRLKWTPEDLQRFRDRWQNVKPIDQPGANPNLDRSDVEEALRSLGMRAPKAIRSESKPSEQDGLRGLQDSGNRRQAPAPVRDAFEAFRRGWKSTESSN